MFLLIALHYLAIIDRKNSLNYTPPRPESWPKWRNWQTRTTQTRVPSGVWVRFPPSALVIPLEKDDFPAKQLDYKPR